MATSLHRSYRICWSPFESVAAARRAMTTERHRRRAMIRPRIELGDAGRLMAPASRARSASARPRSRPTRPPSVSSPGSSPSRACRRRRPAIRREHVEAFIADLLERWKPATAHNRYRGCSTPSSAGSSTRARSATSPMARMKPPRLPEEPPPVLREAELRRLVAACERDKTFDGRRDEAILRVFIDTGARRGEVLGLTLDDVDLDGGPAPRHRQGQPDAARGRSAPRPFGPGGRHRTRPGPRDPVAGP